jgi:hypothetical protein
LGGNRRYNRRSRRREDTEEPIPFTVDYFAPNLDGGLGHRPVIDRQEVAIGLGP